MNFCITRNSHSAVSVVQETVRQSALDAHVEVRHPRGEIVTETSDTKIRTDISPVFRYGCRQASRTAVQPMRTSWMLGQARDSL